MRVMACEPREPNAREQPFDARLPFRLRHALHRKPEPDIVAHRQPGKQRVFLEHHDDAGLRPRDRLAVERDAAGGQRLESRDQFEQRALAASARPEDGDELALRHRQIES